MSKPKVLCDVDGVIADFVGAVLSIIHDETGDLYKHSDVLEWDFGNIFRRYDSPYLTARVWDAIRGEGIAATLQFVDPGTLGGVNKLLQAADVVFVTAPMPGSPTWEYERREWLRARFGNVQVISTEHKAHISGRLLIDDKLSNHVEWGTAETCEHRSGILWDASYNHLSPLPDGAYWRAYNWDDALDIVNSIK